MVSSTRDVVFNNEDMYTHTHVCKTCAIQLASALLYRLSATCLVKGVQCALVAGCRRHTTSVITTAAKVFAVISGMYTD